MKYFSPFLVLLLGVSPLVNAVEHNALTDGQLSCLLEPSKEIELSSEVSGVISELSLGRGDKVKKGQVVMKLNSRLERAALATARARVDFAKRKVKRNEVLYKKGLLSDHERDEMLTEQRLAELTASESYVRLALRQTKSPINGVVVERLLDPGELVDDLPFLKIVSLDPLKAEVIMRSQFYGQISKGMPVTLYAEGRSEQAYVGKVHRVDPLIDAASSTFAISVEIPNKDQLLPAGLKCRVEFSPLQPASE